MKSRKINVSITGCMGRMGQELIKAIKKDNKFKIHSLTESTLISKKISGIKPQLNNESAFKGTNIIVDFTTPKCSFDILRVNGSLEIPTMIAIKLKKNKYDGAIALGCIIKGQTNHNEVIANTIATSLLNISVENLKPIGNAVLSCNNLSQALARTKGLKNRPAEAVNAIISVLNNI